MARPREFDEDQVLETVLTVFWQRGYEATSIADLVEATGLARASLYGAFGDKDALFRRAAERYRERSEAGMREVVAAPSAKAALEKVFGALLSMTCPRKGPRGCFLQLASAGGGDGEEWTRELVAHSLRETERAYEAVIARGQASGEFRNDREPAAVARSLLITAQGLSSVARAGWSRDRLRSVLDDTLAQILA